MKNRISVLAAEFLILRLFASLILPFRTNYRLQL
jgi:hypothetical protein